MRFLDFDSLGKQNTYVKPAVGDTVLFENQKYIVTEVGLKYIHMQHADTGRPGLAKLTDVVKWVETVEEKKEPLTNLSEADLDKEFGSFNANI